MTPRTDLAIAPASSLTPFAEVVPADFARQLERDISDLNERLQERVQSHLAASSRDVQTIQQKSVLLDRLAKALSQCVTKDWFASDITGEVIVGLDAAEVRGAIVAYEAAKKGES